MRLDTIYEIQDTVGGMKAVIFFIALILVSSLGLVFYQYHKFHDGKLHVVFCNVGQGDAIYIRTPAGSDILYDGGPDKTVLDCLTDHQTFWDRSIELILLSHPHADHLVGLMAVMKRYAVSSFDTEELKNKTAMYEALLDLLEKQHTQTRFVLAGDRFRTRDGVSIQVLSPTSIYLQETSPGGLIGEKKEFASLIVQVSYGEFDVLLTGDSQKEAFLRPEMQLESIDVLHVPHHGSGTGLDKHVLDILHPKLAVISVGKNNYGHPNREIIRLLQAEGSKVVRTDKNGTIEIISDGKQWWVKNGK